MWKFGNKMIPLTIVTISERLFYGMKLLSFQIPHDIKILSLQKNKKFSLISFFFLISINLFFMKFNFICQHDSTVFILPCFLFTNIESLLGRRETRPTIRLLKFLQRQLNICVSVGSSVSTSAMDIAYKITWKLHLVYV